MGWLFEAGTTAGRIQAVLVLLIILILLFLWLASDGAGTGAPDQGEPSAVPTILRWDLLAAAALAVVLARNSVFRTAERIVQVAGDLTGGRGRRVQIALSIRLWIATTALAVLTIAPAPTRWVHLGSRMLSNPAADFLWTAAFSVGLAYFAANASAAAISLRL
jgi:hypothetical protein